MLNLSISPQTQGIHRNSLSTTFSEGTELTRAQIQVPRQAISLQRPVHVQVPVFSGASDSPERHPESTPSEKKQARFLRKACVILFASFFWSVLAQNEPALEARIGNLLLVACGFFIYTTFSDIFYCLTQSLSLESFEEQVLGVLEGFLSLCFLFVILFLKDKDAGKYLMIGSACIYLLLASLYVRRFSSKKRKIVRKLTFTIQISLVVAKVLGFISLKWMEVFVPLGLYLGVHQILGSYRLVKLLIKFCRQMKNEEIDFPWFIRNAIQISWLLFYNGLGSLALAIVINLCQQADHEPNEDFMGTVLTITQYYCSFFLGYTLIFFKLTKDFGLDLSEEEPLSPTKSSIKIKGFYLKPQRDPVVAQFMKISSTYFSKISDNEEKDDEEGLIRRSVKTEEDHPCYICETNEADIILMDCGHGGVCKDCVLLSMKKSRNCMGCRTPVQSIYQIEKEPENTRIVKATEIYSIIY